MELNARQTNVLKDLQRAARKSRSGRLVSFKTCECYDGRTIQALLNRGLLKPHDSLPGYLVEQENAHG